MIERKWIHILQCSIENCIEKWFHNIYFRILFILFNSQKAKNSGLFYNYNLWGRGRWTLDFTTPVGWMPPFHICKIAIIACTILKFFAWPCFVKWVRSFYSSNWMGKGTCWNCAFFMFHKVHTQTNPCPFCPFQIVHHIWIDFFLLVWIFLAQPSSRSADQNFQFFWAKFIKLSVFMSNI